MTKSTKLHSGSAASASKASAVASNYTAASGSNSNRTVAQAQPIENARNRPDSSQSLTLDLEGLDLGQGVRSAGGLEQPQKDDVPWNRKPEPRSRSRFRGNTVSAASRIQQEEIVPPREAEVHVEDSFFAHLRKCEDSYDILDTAHALSPSAPSQADDLEIQTASQQVLGGFASLGYSSNTPSQVNIGDVDSEASPYNSMPVSPYLGSRKNRKLPWQTLVPILRDPMTTLDILSIEEMGLHSIDVGNSKEWEGFNLSYQHGTKIKVEEEEGIRTAQWAVAKSNKKQKKWIVAPDSLAASRTVIVSDHIPTGSGSKREIPSPNFDSPPIFVCQASFSLRFLQSGKGASDLSVTLTNPAAHRAKANATKNDLASSQISDKHEKDTLSSAVVSVHNTDAKTKEENIAKEEVDVKRQGTDSRPSLGHSKSSSTIHASMPMVQLQSRRPSLGKSISHDSLSFQSPMLDASRRMSRTSMATVTMNDSATINGFWPNSNSTYKTSSSLVNDTTASDLAFSDYTLGLRAVSDVAGKSSHANSTPSPRTSVQLRPSIPLMRPSTERIPTLSTIDTERMADYYRQSSENLRPTYGVINQFNNTTWQAAVYPSPSDEQRPLIRKDRRLSEWFKKKVLSGGSTSPPTLVTPLPAAWEQQRELHSVAAAAMTSRTTTKGIKTGRPVKSYSNTSKSNSSTSTNSQALKGNVYTSNLGSSFSLSRASLSSTLPSEVEDKEQTKSVKIISSLPLSHMQINAQGHNVWPGVFSQRNERRRSNSEDHLLTVGEVAKRRQEATRTREGLGVPYTPRKASDWQDLANQDDGLTQLSLSMPNESVLSAYNDFSSLEISQKSLSTIDLLDLDNVPNKSMTMLIPLPMGKRSDQPAARYIRISYVPFGKDSASMDDSDRESTDDGHPSATPSQTSLPAWYKKLTSALSTGARSSSPGSNDDSDTDETSSAIGLIGSNGVAESFRIIAKVLEAPNQKKSTFKDYSLPPATPFPVILGWCDQQRSVKLIPEGWQAIGLTNGPADSDSPLGGLADLIIAGCAASMEL